MTDDPELSALIEHTRLRATAVLFAAAQQVKVTGGDLRHAEAAAAIERIAATMKMVTGDVLLKLATADQTSEGLLPVLILSRLGEVGEVLPVHGDAPSFIASIEATVDAILHRARQRMH